MGINGTCGRADRRMRAHLTKKKKKKG